VAKGREVVTSAPDAIAKAVAEITAGKRSLSIPIRERPETVADVPQLGYALLKNALFDMNPWEVGFAGSMVKMGTPTPRQRKVVARCRSSPCWRLWASCLRSVAAATSGRRTSA
jgi:hypothetical protein